MRITVQLIEAATDRHLWAESFQREYRDILALQSEVARAIAREIQITVTPEEEARLAAARPVNPEAYEGYLKGRYFWNQRTRDSLFDGLDYFQKAVELDPTFALGYVGIADSYNILANNAHLPAKNAFPLGKAAALKALDLDSTLGEAHASRAFVLWNYEWDWAGAEKEYQQAIELNPGYATAHFHYGYLLSILGRTEESIARALQARTLDPLYPRIHGNVANMYLRARQYGKAIEEAKKTIDLFPDAEFPRWVLSGAYLWKGDHGKAITEMQKRKEIVGETSIRDPIILAVAGRSNDAAKVFSKFVERADREGKFVAWTQRAMVYSALEEEKKALEWLEAAYEEHDARLYMIRFDPVFDPLRDDPRFQDLLRRMNFPE